jgi:hypothetical protein
MPQHLHPDARRAIAAHHEAARHEAARHEAARHEGGRPDPYPAAEHKKRQWEWPACLSSNGVFEPGIGSQWPVGISRQWPHPRPHYSSILHHWFNFAPNICFIYRRVHTEFSARIVSRHERERRDK